MAGVERKRWNWLKSKRTQAALVVSVVCLLGAAFIFTHHTIRLTAADIQSQLASRFPLEKRKLVFAARFTDPTVAIDPRTGLVDLGISATVSALGTKAIASRADAQGGVRYDSSKGELYLDSPTVEVRHLEIAGVKDGDAKVASGIIAEALREFLDRTPLYRLKGSDTRLLTARRVVKSIRVSDGAIEIELGF